MLARGARDPELESPRPALPFPVRVPSIAVILLASIALACGGSAPEPEEPWERYSLKGKVVQLQDGETKVAVVDHQEIEGWMGAMTMGFPVEDAAEFAKLSEGVEIEAAVMVRGGIEYYLADITIVSEAPVP